MTVRDIDIDHDLKIRLWDAADDSLGRDGFSPLMRDGENGEWYPDIACRFRSDAECLALTEALCPEGYRVVERKRLERLTEYVAADLACTGWPDEDGANPHWERYLAARAALRPGDIDPLPEPADER